MKIFKAAALVGAAIWFTVVTVCHAGVDTTRIDRRQDRQGLRIQKGLASGRLTAEEAQRLQNQQLRIQMMENKAVADGVVTRKERARITHKQNQASRTIYRKKHNKRRR